MSITMAPRLPGLLPIFCRVMSENRQLAGPTRRRLIHGERIDWHRHVLNQLCYPLRGALQVSTPSGMWLVPPHRAVWVAGRRAARASGKRSDRDAHPRVRRPTNPLRLDRPAVLTVDTLLREVIAALSEGSGEDGLPAPGGSPTLDRRQRRNLERVALDRLRRAEELPLDLPQPADDRLRHRRGHPAGKPC